MIGRRHHRRATERNLAALADGSLAPDRAQDVERALAESPELREELRTQTYAVEAVRATEDVRAPASLRARVELAEPVSRPRRVRFAVPAAALAAGTAAVAIAIGGGGSEPAPVASAPTVADAALIGHRAPVAAVPDAADDSATLPGPRAASLRFPYWQDRFGWKAIGTRHDRVQGRPATTVFYRRSRQTVAYTIVSGAPLDVGRAAQHTTRAGTVLDTFSAHGRRVVTWRRRGHTCVLSSTGADEVAMQRLASWRGGGAIAY
jgi:hypothetical protein